MSQTTTGPTIVPLPIDLETLQKDIDKKYGQIYELTHRPGKTESQEKLLETYWKQYEELVRLKKEGVEYLKTLNSQPND